VPFDNKAIPLCGAEIADLHGFNAGFAVSQLAFGLVHGALGKNGEVVLCAETIAKVLGFDFAALKVSANGDEHQDDEYNRGDDELVIRDAIEYSVELKLHDILLRGVSAAVKGGWRGTCTQFILGGVAPEC
jgi:hypothetical protein